MTFYPFPVTSLWRGSIGTNFSGMTGYPSLERIDWVPVGDDDPKGVLIHPQFRDRMPGKWKMVGAIEMLCEVVFPEPGVAPDVYDPYNWPLQPGMVLVTLADYLLGYEAYRQRVDPWGIPEMGTPGHEIPDPDYYINPDPVTGTTPE